MRVIPGIGIAAVLALLPARAEAFCGFYIDTGGAEMFNNATQVVLMRVGTRTVLSMQNSYQGPLKDFAMVVPVPTVLSKADVRTLPKAVFDKVNAMSAPRLVEYWEQDPCIRPEGMSVDVRNFSMHSSSDLDFGVKVEAKFDVDEYKIVILSAKDSTGLDRYLRAENYKIPAGAAPLLRPYVEHGSKFFVAKVDPKKVKFVNGQAVLSPLRFHYDSEEFSLPIRLGLANSSGTQDLIVNILAPEKRYEVANYPNAFIPTNLDVVDGVRTQFGAFYAALFDRTLQQHPGAVVTEYAWAASSCDPCPGYRLQQEDFALLGEDTIVKPPPPPPPPPPPVVLLHEGEIDLEPEIDLSMGLDMDTYDFVLTRLHARYGKGGAPNDLVFRVGAPIVGGRERRNDKGVLDTTAMPSPSSDERPGRNAFQGRYIIRHPWTQPIECEDPRRGWWGATPGGSGRRKSLSTATDTAFAPRGKTELQNLVAQDVPELAIKRGVPLSPPLPVPVPGQRIKAHGCACNTSGGAESLGLGALGLVVLSRRRRR